MNDGRVAIPGSTPRHDGKGERNATPLARELTVSIILRRKPGRADLADQLLSGDFRPVSREQAVQQTSADPHDVELVETFAREFGLRVIEADTAERLVKASGSAADLNRAFGIQLGMFGNYVSYEGPITVPAALAGVIIAVLGLDNHPIARAREPAFNQ